MLIVTQIPQISQKEIIDGIVSIGQKNLKNEFLAFFSLIETFIRSVSEQSSLVRLFHQYDDMKIILCFPCFDLVEFPRD